MKCAANGDDIVGLSRHAILPAFVAAFRAVRVFFRAAVAVFLTLRAASTVDGNSRCPIAVH
jgi:hypothetical protein